MTHQNSGGRTYEDQHLDTTPIWPITEEERRAAGVVVVENLCRHSVVSDTPPTEDDKQAVHDVLEVLGLVEYVGLEAPMRHKYNSKKRTPAPVKRGWGAE